MLFSEAIALGRVAVSPQGGILLSSDREFGCALGMAIVACGLGKDSSYVDIVKKWPWVQGELKYFPCGCAALSDAKMWYMNAVAHIFDKHVMGTSDVPWTLDQLIDWVRSVEPKEIATVAQMDTAAPSEGAECAFESRR